MHLESTLSLKERRSGPGSTVSTTAPPENRRSLKSSNKPPKTRAPALGEVGKRQTLNVFAADGRDVSAEVGSEEAVVDETAFVKQPAVIFTRGKKVGPVNVALRAGGGDRVGVGGVPSKSKRPLAQTGSAGQGRQG